MFKDGAKSKIHPANFGAGSTISLDTEKYLLVSSGANGIGAVSLSTFEMLGTTSVQDPNHLTEEEARKLFKNAFPAMTFSEAKLDPKGVKNG